MTGATFLGAFLVLHVATNASALRGERAFASAVEARERLPGHFALEVVFVLLPLLVHVATSVAVTRDPKETSPLPQPWARPLLRATGALALVFVLLHVSQFAARVWLGGLAPAALHGALEARLSSVSWGIPWVAIAHVLGLAAVGVHFAFGAWSAAVRWNVARSPRGKRVAAMAAGAVAAALFVFGAATVVGFATGSSSFPAAEPMPDGPPRPACSGEPR